MTVAECAEASMFACVLPSSVASTCPLPTVIPSRTFIVAMVPALPKLSAVPVTSSIVPLYATPSSDSSDDTLTVFTGTSRSLSCCPAPPHDAVNRAMTTAGNMIFFFIKAMFSFKSPAKISIFRARRALIADKRPCRNEKMSIFCNVGKKSLPLRPISTRKSRIRKLSRRW